MAEFDLSPLFDNASGTDGAPMDTPPPAPNPDDWNIPPEAPLAYDHLPSLKPDQELEPHYTDEAQEANATRFEERRVATGIRSEPSGLPRLKTSACARRRSRCAASA